MTTIEIVPAAPTTQLGRPSWLVVHYQREDAGYGDWALHAWGDIAPGQLTGFPGGHAFAGEDAWGRFAWVRLAEDARAVGFLVVDRTGAKDVAADRHVDPAVTPEIWLRHGDPEIYTERPPATPAPDDLVVIHYRRPDGDYAGWGLHAWEGTGRKPVRGVAAFET